MTKIIAIVFQIIAVAGGIGLGLFLKSSGNETATTDDDAHGEDAKSDSHDEKKSKDGGKKKKSKSDHKESKDDSDDHGKSSGADSNYMKFSRQFIVPVVGGRGVNALVVMDINLELSPSAKQDVYAQEPKIRDALLTSLLRLSNDGAFSENLLQEQNIEGIRAALLTSAQSVLGEDVIGVLILSVAKQEL